MAGEEDDEPSSSAATESSKTNGISAPATNGTAAETTPVAKEDPELAEMKALAAEDGSAEESNTGTSILSSRA